MKHGITRVRVLWLAAALLVAALACGPAALTGGQTEPAEGGQEDAGQEPLTPAATAAGAPDTGGGPQGELAEVAVPDEGFDHIEQGQSGEYDHFPPSSGQHWGVAAEWGFYAESIRPEMWIHNLEHGGIVVLFDCAGGMGGCPDLVTALEDWSESVPASKYGYPKLLIFPHSGLDSLIVALAWGWELSMDELDTNALDEFYRRHHDLGPEDVP